MVSIRTVKPDVSSHKQKNGSSATPEYSKKDGIMYCLSCGKENSHEVGVCLECGKNRFLLTSISEMIGGYIELAKEGRIKIYYNKRRFTKSIVRMNPKRMIHQLLMNKDKMNVSKEIIDKIYNANIT